VKKKVGSPLFPASTIYLPTPALPEQLFSISMDMFIFKNLSFIRSTERKGELGGIRYLVEVSSRTILTAGEDCRSLSHTNILSKFL
jgi:hypothetical protein